MRTSEVILLLLAAVTTVLHAHNIDVPGENLRLTIPDTWHTLPLDHSLRSLEVENDTHTGALFLDVIPNTRNDRVDDPKVIHDMDYGYSSANPRLNGLSVSIQHEGATTLDGLPCYEMTVVFVKPGDPPFYMQTYNIAVNGKGYTFSIRAPKSESSLGEFEKVMQTIHFSGPRTVPPVKPITPAAKSADSI